MDGSEHRPTEAERRLARELMAAVDAIDPENRLRHQISVATAMGELDPADAPLVRRSLGRLLGSSAGGSSGSPGEEERVGALAAAAGVPPDAVRAALLVLAGGIGGREPAAPCRTRPECACCDLAAFCATWRARAPLDRQALAASPDEALLGELIGGARATDLAAELLGREAHGLRALGALGWEELAGLSPGSRRRLLAAFELARRWAGRRLRPGRVYRSAREVHEHLAPLVRDLEQETLFVLLLDGRNRFRRWQEVSRGTLTSSLAHPREIFSAAIRERAAAIILVHNHPSGDPSPSVEDDLITERICAVGDLVGIRVLDHVILGEGRFTSYLESGRLPDPGSVSSASSIVATDGRPGRASRTG